MLRDNLVGLIKPMLSSAGANPLALRTARKKTSDDRPPCLENPRPEGAESTLTENAPSPFHAEPRQVQIEELAPHVSHICSARYGALSGQSKYPELFSLRSGEATKVVHPALGTPDKTDRSVSRKARSLGGGRHRDWGLLLRPDRFQNASRTSRFIVRIAVMYRLVVATEV
jgi:hypothetical protein